MTETGFFIEEPFKQGLRPEETYQNREGFLEACFNLIPDDGGLKAYEGPVDPFQGGVAVDFPLPQVLVGRDITLLAGTTNIETINRNVTPWTKSPITTKDPSAPAVDKAIVSGTVWHFADLGPAWYAANGSCVVFRTGLDRLEGTTTPVTYTEDEVMVNTLCESRGRMFLGGFDKDNIWSNAWDTIFSGWTSSADLDNISFLGPDGPDSNWVMWSTIGGGDFPLWLFMPSGYTTDLGPTADRILQHLKRNEFGWMPMDWQGTVQVLKPLGDKVIVYGDQGITALVLRGSQVGREEIADLGVLGRGAVGGDLGSHFFIDQDRVLWSLNSDLELVRLGYEEWLSSFPATSTTVTLRPQPEEIYLSSPDKGYVLTKNGLAEHPDKLTSVAYLEGIFYAVHTSAASTDIRVQTGSFDMRRQALKTIHDIQVLYSDLTNVKVTILYRYDHSSTFESWGPIGVNPQGVVTPMLTARDFKIKVTGTPGSEPRLDEIEVRWNLVDKRAVRGLYN